MEQMTPEELKLKLDQLLDEGYFPPVAVIRDGHPRLVVLPYEGFRSMRRTVRKVVDLLGDAVSEQDLKEIAESKMPDGFEHLDEELKADKE